MTGPSEWHAQQIAEFLAAVSAYEDEPAALEGAVEQAAEAMEAEVAAVVRDGEVLASVGFRAGHVPVADLVALAAERGSGFGAGASPLIGGPPVLRVAGAGHCATVAVPVDCTTTLLVARSGESFASDEALLLRGMGRVLAQALQMLRAVDNERALRLEALRHMEENQRLVTVLQERQTLLERLFRIQRSISHRLPIGDVLDSTPRAPPNSSATTPLRCGSSTRLKRGTPCCCRPMGSTRPSWPTCTGPASTRG